MAVIDEDGRVFGLVNIIDALVVLLVVAVLVAGIALVDPFAPPPAEETRYATIALGGQPPYLVERVTAGDRMELENAPDNLTITDVYRAPIAGNGTQIVVRARVNGERVIVDEDRSQFHFGGEPFLVGHTLTIETLNYTVDGQVTRIDHANPSLPTAETAVVLETTAPTAVVDDIQPGDTFAIAGHTVAALDSVAVYPTGDPGSKRVVLGAVFVTRRDGDRRVFGDQAVQPGATLHFRTTAYAVKGRVVRVGTTEQPGTPTTTTATITVENIDPARAGNIRVGQTETSRGETIARIVAKRQAPAMVILESDDGNIYERAHPRNVDVTLTVELHTRQTSAGLRFHGAPLQIGDTVILDLGPITIRGELTRIS